MKFPRKLFYCFAFLLTTGAETFAQNFEGIFSYSIDYKVVLEDRPDLEIYKSMIPHQMDMSIKGQNSHLKFIGGMTQGLLGDILFRSKDKTLYSIFDFNKTYLKTPVESLKKAQLKNGLKANSTDEKLTIQGYECTKYIVKDEKEGTETYIWCTSTINNASSSVMTYFLESMTQINVTGLNGLPLQIQFKGKEFDLTLLAQSKEEKELPELLFEIPKEYTLNKTN